MTVNAVLQNICNIAISQLRRMLSCKRKKKHKKGINTSLCDPLIYFSLLGFVYVLFTLVIA